MSIFKRNKKKPETEYLIQMTPERRRLIRSYNKNLIQIASVNKIEIESKLWASKNPAPYKEGTLVMLNMFSKQHSTLGWFSNPIRDFEDNSIMSKMKDDSLVGPFVLQAHKVYVNVSSVLDEMEQRIEFPDEDIITQAEANLIVSAWFTRRENNTNYDVFEWSVQFDWDSLKIPYDNALGYFKSSGYNANYFTINDRDNRWSDIRALYKLKTEMLDARKTYNEIKDSFENARNKYQTNG